MVDGVACGLSGLSANLCFTQNMSIPGSLTETLYLYSVHSYESQNNANLKSRQLMLVFKSPGLM